MSEQRTGRGAVAMGPTSDAVAANVRRVRAGKGMSTYQLADALKRGGRPIAASAISKIERGDRRVDVDDLMALAVALGVSPSALLLPMEDAPSRAVEITGAGEPPVRANVAWDWMDGKRPLRLTRGHEETELLEYDLYSRPRGRRLHETPLRDMTEEERAEVNRALGITETERRGDG